MKPYVTKFSTISLYLTKFYDKLSFAKPVKYSEICQNFSISAGLEPLSTAAGETNFKRKQPLKKDCVCV